MRTAILVKPVRGKMIKWRRGMRVKAEFLKGIGWCLERRKWRYSHLPLFSRIVAVPKSYFRLDPLPRKRKSTK